MSALRVLITNNTLAQRAGSELYVRDLANALRKRGHTPVAYSTALGEVAAELTASGVCVVDDLNQLRSVPDLIHGQQPLELLTALLHFPGVPAIQFIHNSSGWQERPAPFPRILRYVAVDYACRDLLREYDIPADRIRVLLNFVDLARFRPRRSPLPPVPQRALLLSNYASEDTHLPAVREACARAGIPLDVVGARTNTAASEPEKILADYDLVFAKARCALEAMAVGTAVLLCDFEGSGPLVTSENFAFLRPLNFGRRTLLRPLQATALLAEMKRYDPADALRVSQRVRASAGHEAVMDDLVSLYEEVVREFAESDPLDKLAEDRAAAAYLRQFKRDFDANTNAVLRLRQRLEQLPLVGRTSIKLARALLRRK
ncbi:MAG: hypothetical protein QOJ88_360 [Pyrinomonadaceae bacterium]|jgi:glycosyltransferase involved in cell wall biosynthesis|nr:hypothetical protein [Pyrinomonadaceae bacterium]